MERRFPDGVTNIIMNYYSYRPNYLDDIERIIKFSYTVKYHCRKMYVRTHGRKNARKSKAFRKYLVQYMFIASEKYNEAIKYHGHQTIANNKLDLEFN